MTTKQKQEHNNLAFYNLDENTKRKFTVMHHNGQHSLILSEMRMLDFQFWCECDGGGITEVRRILLWSDRVALKLNRKK